MHLKLLVVCIFAMVVVSSAPVDPVPVAESEQLQEKSALITPEETVQLLENKYLTSDGQDLLRSVLLIPGTALGVGKK